VELAASEARCSLAVSEERGTVIVSVVVSPAKRVVRWKVIVSSSAPPEGGLGAGGASCIEVLSSSSSFDVSGAVSPALFICAHSASTSMFEAVVLTCLLLLTFL
jgi:hypothetical protein